MNSNGSKSLSLSSFDWKKVLTGLGLGLAGAVVTWASAAVVPALEETGNGILLLTAALLATCINAARKWLMDTTDQWN